VPKLQLIDVSKKFGNIAALDNVTLQVDDKEYACIIGPSGCGKSTLIKCVAGIMRPDSGEVRIDDQPVQNIQIEDRRIGYVFQEIALFPNMRVRDNISYGLNVRHAARERITAVTNEMLDLVNVRERSRAYPRELSGGAQQKVAVGRAIATGSQLFLLDEPLGALDALVRAEQRYELKRLASDLGLTIIHVTHDQEEALSIADRVVVMKQGRIVEVGTPSNSYFSPKSLFAENFVGETNLLETRVLETDNVWCVVDISGHKVRVFGPNREVGQRVVVSVRPEAVRLTPVSGVIGSGWRAQIKQATFLGGVSRYLVDVEGGIELMAHVPATENRDFRVGESVGVLPIEEHMLLFDYPTEGLEKEIALE
jgi:ABC-type Fe3+/spermidine/putrescine transport system ATPase subunit